MVWKWANGVKVGMWFGRGSFYEVLKLSLVWCLWAYQHFRDREIPKMPATRSWRRLLYARLP